MLSPTILKVGNVGDVLAVGGVVVVVVESMPPAPGGDPCEEDVVDICDEVNVNGEYVPGMVTPVEETVDKVDAGS